MTSITSELVVVDINGKTTGLKTQPGESIAIPSEAPLDLHKCHFRYTIKAEDFFPADLLSAGGTLSLKFFDDLKEEVIIPQFGVRSYSDFIDEVHKKRKNKKRRWN